VCASLVFSIKYLQNNYRTRNLQTASIDIDTDWWNKRREKLKKKGGERESESEKERRPTRSISDYIIDYRLSKESKK
jgi:hypothetical protein